MRTPRWSSLVLAAAAAAGCGGSASPPNTDAGNSGDDGGSHIGSADGVCGAAPAACANRCQTEVTDFEYADCCDSTTCNCDPSTQQWKEWACDPPPEYEQRCPTCNPGEICVLQYNGTCGGLGSGTCVPSTCDSCSSDCDAQLCGAGSGSGSGASGVPFSCEGADGCGQLPAGYFGCYGP